MTRADIERLSREYPAGEPREGRLARALQVAAPAWRELGDEILGDLDAAHAPVLTESAAMTVLGVLESTLLVVREGGGLLLDVWRTRRSDPALLAQPREQWPAGPSTVAAGFEGYAPGSIPYSPTQLRTDATLIRRMAASLGDAARGARATFD